MNLSKIILEGWNDRDVKGKISDLSYDILSSYFEAERFYLPNDDDSSRYILGQRDFDHYRNIIMKNYGDVEVQLDREGEYDHDRFKILDKKFIDAKDSYSKTKAAVLANWRKDPNYYPGD